MKYLVAIGQQDLNIQLGKTRLRRLCDIEEVPPTAFRITVDGESVLACEGESVLSLLLALGKVSISSTNHGEVVGAYCGMGICHSCTVRIDDVGYRRACQQNVSEGMSIQTRSNRVFDSKEYHD